MVITTTTVPSNIDIVLQGTAIHTDQQIISWFFLQLTASYQGKETKRFFNGRYIEDFWILHKFLEDHTRAMEEVLQ